MAKTFKPKDYAPLLVILGTIIIIALAIWGIGAYSSMPKIAIGSIASQGIGTTVGYPAYDPVSYIVGEIPDSLISQVGKISAAIILVALFLMILITFSDILVAFSMFSKSTSWIIAIALTIITANLKILMLIAFWSFAVVGGIGIASVIVGVAIPFIIFLVLNLILGSQLLAWRQSREGASRGAEVAAGAGSVASAIGGFKSAADAFSS